MSTSTAREGEAEVAEHLDRDVPLAVPLHRVLDAVERLRGVEDLDAVALGQRQLRDAPRSSRRMA